MNELPQRLLQILWDRYQDSESVFQALIELLNQPNQQLAVTAKTVLVQLCSPDPKPLITQATKQGLSPAHRARIITVIGDMGQPLEISDAIALVNNRRLQSKRVVTAVIGLFDALDAGLGTLKCGGIENATRGGGQMLYKLLKTCDLDQQNGRRETVS